MIGPSSLAHFPRTGSFRAVLWSFGAAALLGTTFPLSAGAEPELPRTGLIDGNGAVAVGRRAPGFDATTLEGKTISLESLRGQPVLIDFSSIFCSSCQETIKEFVRLDEKYEDDDLTLVMVTDGMGSEEVTKNFFNGVEARYTVIPDRDFEIFTAYGVSVIPFQVLVNREGIVRALHVGFDPELEQVLGLPPIHSPSEQASPHKEDAP